jgi:[ribosomal protein S18]-alanine N-acetyltransferase
VKIRLADSVDVPSIVALERASLTAAHWTEQQYLQLFEPCGDRPERLALVAESQTVDTTSGIAGFLVARLVAPEWELENIVVAPAARRRGIGRQLLDALLTTTRKTNRSSVFLEVRESNVAARSLYKKLGFQQTGRRPAYYINPSEDAILYCIDLP